MTPTAVGLPEVSGLLNPINNTPEGFDPSRDLPQGFMDLFLPLHRPFTPRQQELAAKRLEVLQGSLEGDKPRHRFPSDTVRNGWRITLPEWCQDQRNQMTGPADDAELVVKMLNSGAPGVMLDLEDSMANSWEHLLLGIANIVAALEGRLTYADTKRARTVGIERSSVAIWSRVRGLHLSQAGVVAGDTTSASLFDLALIAWHVQPARLKHPLAIYIPKSESAEEALWWRDVFGALEQARGWSPGFIRCMALVESHPLAFQMEEFLWNLRGHIVGLNLGRWDYMASLIHFTLEDPAWVLPDRNTIPHDVPFFQRLRTLLVDVCHRRGALAIGGMTALYPSREDAELNARALAVLEKDKKNEANCGMDGAWTGHPDQNTIAVGQFPAPNQLARGTDATDRWPDLRPAPTGVGKGVPQDGIPVFGGHGIARARSRYPTGLPADGSGKLLHLLRARHAPTCGSIHSTNRTYQEHRVESADGRNPKNDHWKGLRVSEPRCPVRLESEPPSLRSTAYHGPPR